MSRIGELRAECERLGLDMTPPSEEFLAEFDDAARSFRYPLPDDYVWFMRNCSPDRGYHGFWHPIPPLTSTNIVGGQYDGLVYFNYNIARSEHRLEDWIGEVDPNADQPWRKLLVAVLRSEADRRYMLDYRHDAENPPVIYLRDPGPIRVLDYGFEYNMSDWVQYLAPSFTDLVKQFIDSPSEMPHVDMQPYKYVDEMLAWRRSTFEYLDAHCGPMDPSYFPY